LRLNELQKAIFERDSSAMPHWEIKPFSSFGKLILSLFRQSLNKGLGIYNVCLSIETYYSATNNLHKCLLVQVLAYFLVLILECKKTYIQV